MLEFSYSNSNHAKTDTPAAAPAAAAPAAPAVPAADKPAAVESKPFSYSNTNQPLPQGMPADQLPDAVRELREADPTRRMFSPQVTYREAIAIGEDWPAELRRQYGEQGAQQALADAQRLIARDPRLAQWLAATGLGSHPAYVRAAVQKARSRGR